MFFFILKLDLSSFPKILEGVCVCVFGHTWVSWEVPGEGEGLWRRKKKGGGVFQVFTTVQTHTHQPQLMGFDGISWKPQSDPAPTPPLFD